MCRQCGHRLSAGITCVRGTVLAADDTRDWLLTQNSLANNLRFADNLLMLPYWSGFWRSKRPSVRSLSLAVPAIAAVLMLGATSVQASSISSVDFFKQEVLQQTGNGSTTSLVGYFFSADLYTTVPNPYTSVSMSYPGPGSPTTLTNNGTTGSSTQYNYQTPYYSTLSAFNTAFPTGTYTFTGGTDTANFLYTADDYPQSTPYLTGTEFSSLQGMNTSQAFTFNFNPFVTGSKANASYIFFTISNNTTGQTAFSDGFLSAATTSVTVAANTLIPGDSYTYDIDYSNRDTVTGTGGASQPFLGFDVRTVGNFTAAAAATTPEPATAVLFGFALVGFAAIRRRVS